MGHSIAALALNRLEDEVGDFLGIDDTALGVERVGDDVPAGAVGPPAGFVCLVGVGIRDADDAGDFGKAAPVDGLRAVERARRAFGRGMRRRT